MLAHTVREQKITLAVQPWGETGLNKHSPGAKYTIFLNY